MEAFKGYYNDENGDFYELKEKVSTGAIFTRWNGFIKTAL